MGNVSLQKKAFIKYKFLNKFIEQTSNTLCYLYKKFEATTGVEK